MRGAHRAQGHRLGRAPAPHDPSHCPKSLAHVGLWRLESHLAHLPAWSSPRTCATVPCPAMVTAGFRKLRQRDCLCSRDLSDSVGWEGPCTRQLGNTLWEAQVNPKLPAMAAMAVGSSLPG